MQPPVRLAASTAAKEVADTLPVWHPDSLAARLPYLRRRALLTQATRAFFAARGFAEVETPYAVRAPGEEVHLRSFRTEAERTDGSTEPRWLHTSPEFAMKRLLVAGAGPILQLARHVGADVLATEGDAAALAGPLCGEAVRLARLLLRLFPAEPEIMGLLALTLLQHARAAARLDAEGEVVLLDDQDRTLWDRCAIAQGLALIDKALRHRRPSAFQLQAALAGLHARAATPADTDWAQMDLLYAALETLQPSSVVRLNRAVAVARLRGPPAGATPGHVGWRELHAGEREAAFAFYAELFGWTKTEAVDLGPMDIHQTFATNGVSGGGMVGGMMTKTDALPAAVWFHYFNVDDIDAAASRTRAAGGEILMGPHQVPGGSWIAQCRDPQEALFATIGPRR